VIANIPFIYKATVLRRGRKKPSTENFVSLALLDIPDFSAKDTVEVVSWRRFALVRNMEDLPDLTADLGRNSIRLVDGSFYFPIAANRHVHTAYLPLKALGPDEPLADDIFRELKYELERLNRLQPHSSAAKVLRQHLLGFHGFDMGKTTPAVMEVLETDIDGRRQSVLGEAKTHIAIDGILWKRVSQPVVALQSNDQGRYLDIHVGETSYGSILNESSGLIINSPAKTMLFPVCDLDDAKDLARERGLYPHWAIPDYRIEASDMMQFDRRIDIIARTAEFLLHTHAPLIGYMGSKMIGQWLEIRERISSFRTQGNASALEGLLESEIPRFLASSGNAAGEDAWNEIHDCLELYNRIGRAPTASRQLRAPR
jgi:hypothetical protein